MELSPVPPDIPAEPGKSSKRCVTQLDFPGIGFWAQVVKSSCTETQPWSSGSACKPRA